MSFVKSRPSSGSILGVDDAQAAYWNGPVTRSEVQAVLDDYTAATVRLQEQVMKLDFALSYLLDQSKVTPEQITTYMKSKMDEFAEQQKAAHESRA